MDTDRRVVATDATSSEPSPDPLAGAPEQVRSPWFEFWRKFRRQRVALFAGAFVILLVLVAVAAP
jgi:glutathione transport system permease protein